MSVSITEIKPLLHAELRDCPAALILQKARRAIIDFCTITHAWQHNLPPMDLIKDQQSYLISTETFPLFVAGAGTQEANGTYELDAYSGYWVKGVYQIRYREPSALDWGFFKPGLTPAPAEWSIMTEAAILYVGQGGTSAGPWTASSWEKINGFDPAPVVEQGVQFDSTVVHRILTVHSGNFELRGDVEYSWSEDKSILRLSHRPPETILQGLKVRVALRPTMTAAVISNERLWNDWHLIFADGTQHLLMRMKDKPWTNYQLAEDAKTKFLNGIARARDEVRKRRLNTLPFARSPYSFV